MINKKGFTLVEILATIVLIALLLGLGIPGVMKISDNMKKRAYNTKVDLIEQAAILWGQDNKTRLQSDDCIINGENYKCKKISIDNLIGDDYLEADGKNEGTGKYVYNNPKDNSDIVNTCVYIYKKNNRVYSFYPENDTSCVDVIEPEEEIINYPTLAESNTWYTSSTARSIFTTINFVDEANEEIKATATEKWPAAVDSDGDGILNDDIMCYVNDTTLTIAGNGTGKIMASTNLSYMFFDPTQSWDAGRFSNVTAITGLPLLDTSNVTDMSYMFSQCTSLTFVDVSNFNTSKVTTMERMFNNCPRLTSLDVSNFETIRVVNLAWMFCGMNDLLQIDVRKWNTENVTTMEGLFSGCTSLTSIDVSNFNTSKVTTMERMFNDCSSLTSLDISYFNTLKVKNMKYMFSNCSSLPSIDVGNLNTSSVTSMMGMFSHCTSLTSIDISTFNISKLKSMQYMFYGCHSLESIDVSMFDTSNVTNLSYMFLDCPSLTTFTFGENFGQSNNIPTNVLYTMFDLYEDTTLETTVHGANDIMKAYNWAADDRKVTFVD